MQKRQLIGRVTPPPPQPMTKKREMCGAKTRDGDPCKNYALPNGRCRMHGGHNVGPGPEARARSSKEMRGNKRTLKHGIYGSGMLDHEKEMYDEFLAQVGTLDNEIVMAEIMLKRAANAQAHWERVRGIYTRMESRGDALAYGIREGILEPYEYEEKMEQVPVGGFETGIRLGDKMMESLKRKKHDFSAEVHKYAKLVGTLKEKRKVLMEANTGDVDFVRKLAEDLRDFNDNAGPTLPGGSMFGQDDNDKDREE